MRPRTALRERREYLDLSQEQVAQELRVSTTTYRSWERGGSMRIGRRARLAEVLDWSPRQLARALDAHSAPDGHLVPAHLSHLISLEQAAAEVVAFEATTIHGLLQTRAYALAVESVAAVVDSEYAALKADLRMDRQAVLTGDSCLNLNVILDESVLHRVAGGPEVMAEQLAHLASISDTHPNVTVRILPFSAGLFVFGSFTMFAKDGEHRPFMVCVEDRGGTNYLEREHDIDAHMELFEFMSVKALNTTDSVALIRATEQGYR